LETAKLVRQELGIRPTKTESAVDTFKRAKATLKENPRNKNLADKLTVFERTLQVVKNQNATATTNVGPTGIYDRPGANTTGWTSVDELNYQNWLSNHKGNRKDYKFWLMGLPNVNDPTSIFNRPGGNFQTTYLTQEQVNAQNQAAQNALNQGASPLFQYAAKKAQNEMDNTPESEDKANADEVTPQEAIEATSSAGMNNKTLFMVLAAGTTIYFLTKKGKH
jgi:hypothetical protein